MKFDNALEENSRFKDSYESSRIRDYVSSWAVQSKKLKPMSSEFLEKFKDVKYGYKGSKEDPENWKHYKKFFHPSDSEMTSV